MSTTAGPYGFRPIGRIGSTPYAGGTRWYGLSANSATGFFTGDIVHMAAGVPTVLTTTPAVGTVTNLTIGVFVGCSYVSSSNNMVYAPYLPANAITGGATNVQLEILDDPNAIFQIQADGLVALTNIGKNAQLTGFSAGVTSTGLSGVKIATATIGATTTLPVRIIDVPVLAGVSTPGDAYTDCYVIFNFGAHQYQQTTGA